MSEERNADYVPVPWSELPTSVLVCVIAENVRDNCPPHDRWRFDKACAELDRRTGCLVEKQPEIKR